MITVRNEFEPVPAYEHIAGCSLGAWSDRQTTMEMIDTLDKVTCHVDVKSLYKELAGLNDDDSEEMFDMQNEISDHLNYYMPMPDYCSVVLHDSEWHVLPNLELAQEECESFDDYPEEFCGQTILVVNDHGNVTCQYWSAHDMDYITIWDMV